MTRLYQFWQTYRILQVCLIAAVFMVGARGFYATNSSPLLPPSIGGSMIIFVESEMGWPWTYRLMREPISHGYDWWGSIPFSLNLAVWGLMTAALCWWTTSLCNGKLKLQFSLLHLMAAVTASSIALGVSFAPWPRDAGF